MQIKHYILIVLTTFILLLGFNNYRLSNKVDSLNSELDISKANEKTILNNNSILKEDNRVLQLTVDQLNWFSDSILVKLNDTRKQLDIKDKDIKALQYQLSVASKTDTVIFRDTLFKDPGIKIDTTLSDKWYNLDLGLLYPSTIVVSPSFISERMVFTKVKKETIDPPKNCWIGRLLQKKHKVLTVEVVENNPYIINKQEKYIKVLE